MKELASITRSTFSAVDFNSTNHILAAVSFCCYYWNAVWICLLVKASTWSFGRRDKRIEISKVKSTSRDQHICSFSQNRLSQYSGECFDSQLSGNSKFRAKEAAFSSLLYTFTANSSTLPYCCSNSNSVELLSLSSRQGETSLAARNKAKVKRLYSIFPINVLNLLVLTRAVKIDQS